MLDLKLLFKIMKVLPVILLQVLPTITWAGQGPYTGTMTDLAPHAWIFEDGLTPYEVSTDGIRCEMKLYRDVCTENDDCNKLSSDSIILDFSFDNYIYYLPLLVRYKFVMDPSYKFKAYASHGEELALSTPELDLVSHPGLDNVLGEEIDLFVDHNNYDVYQFRLNFTDEDLNQIVKSLDPELFKTAKLKVRSGHFSTISFPLRYGVRRQEISIPLQEQDADHPFPSAWLNLECRRLAKDQAHYDIFNKSGGVQGLSETDYVNPAYSDFGRDMMLKESFLLDFLEQETQECKQE